MGIAFSEPPKARLLLAVMWRPEMPEAVGAVELCFGKLVSRSEPYDFNHTNYYQTEMGEGLRKCFVELEGKHGRDALIEAKHRAVEFEKRFEREGARRVNVDPLILTPENIVIATSKAFPHRAYLGRGVYADVAFLRQKGAYQAMPWAYLDYVRQLPYFDEVRSRLEPDMLFL